MESDLAPLFFPRSLALVGASNHTHKWGFRILRNIISGGFHGGIYPVNPGEERVLGLQAYPSVADLPEGLDLAVVCTPVSQSLEVVRQCAARGVRFAVMIPAGYGETGGEGMRAQQGLVDEARKGGTRLVGPNSMGIMSSPCSLYAYMSAARPQQGAIAFVSQSGNLGTQILGAGQREGLGFRFFASSGNEADLASQDYLAYFAGEEGIKVILAYIEGFSDGRAFAEKARRASLRKPVVVYKAGRTPAGECAAASHTGVLSTPLSIYRGVFRQAGLVTASSTEQMLDLVKAFSSLPLPRGKRVAVLSWGGGWGVISADACQEEGFDLPHLSSQTLTAMDELLPSYWPRSNPVDLVGTLELENHLRCLEMLAADPAFDAVLALGTITGFADFQEQDRAFLERMVELMAAYEKPILAVKLFEEYQADFLRRHCGLVFPSPERAVAALSRMYQYWRFLQANG
jgi:acyl-CoA synthetase (NDP forming)